MNRINLFFVLMFLFSRHAVAWQSVTAPLYAKNTHEPITKESINLLSSLSFPDIDKFYKQIINGGNSEKGHTDADGKESKSANGGNVKNIWDFKTKEFYYQKNFSQSYFHLGQIAHLTQDQAVPAHSANIFHAWEIPLIGLPSRYDDLEKYSYWHVEPTADYVKYYIGKKPLAYYYDEVEGTQYSIIKQTQDKLSEWKYPEDGKIKDWIGLNFWLETKNSLPEYKYIGQAFLGNPDNTSMLGGWGRYGGPINKSNPDGTDMYEYEIEWYYPERRKVLYCSSPTIAQSQMNEAVAHTSGLLMAVSKSLPPIVTALNISNPNIELGQTVNINFKIMENRTPEASVYITIDDPNGTGIISDEYKTGKAITLELEPDPNQLPYAKAFTIPWDGKLSNGEYPSSGQHKLYVTAIDADGNKSDSSISVEFVIDTGEPFISGFCYYGFQGISQMNPACSNLCTQFGGYYMTIVVQDASSGIKRISITGPTGQEVYSKGFTREEHIEYYADDLTNLVNGQYKIIAEDWDGNKTV